VLDGLGLGPKGPPVPPPAVFAVVPYPVKRQAPTVSELGQYTFTFVSVEDPLVVHTGVSDWLLGSVISGLRTMTTTP
jgi:hypothetical protein